MEGYAVPIFPIRHPSEWGVPNDIQQIVILPPICKVKREDLGGKGFHQLGKVVHDIDVHNARVMVIIDKIARLCLQVH